MTEILTADNIELLLTTEASVELIEVSSAIGPPGPKGDPGDPGTGGAASFVSADPSNRLRTGTDAKLYVPDDLTPDPLAYYILAKN